MGISKVTRNCQITLPKDVRMQLGVKEGDEVLIVHEDNSIVIRKINEDPVMAAVGVWKGMKETGAQYQKRLRAEWKKRERKLNW